MVFITASTMIPPNVHNFSRAIYHLIKGNGAPIAYTRIGHHLPLIPLIALNIAQVRTDYGDQVLQVGVGDKAWDLGVTRNR